MEDDFEGDLDEFLPVPWHGVLAPEGVLSGDGRKFGTLDWRDLPLPLAYQYVSDDGHKGSTVVGQIAKIWRDDNGLVWGQGTFNDRPEADIAIGMLMRGDIRGVSVDADQYTMQVEDEDGNPITDLSTFDGKLIQNFTTARIAGATLCAIPAFAEAYVALGESDDDMLDNKDKTGVAPAEDDDYDEEFAQLVASAAEFAPGTKDGPGWITNPRATARIRRYWTKGKGALKIGWGAPYDFYRCRAQLGKYVKNPDWLNGLCANMHKEVLGVWPGREGIKAQSTDCLDCLTGPALTASPSVAVWKPPVEWFRNPGLTKPSAITVTPEGRVFGHVAQWGVCHVAFGDRKCVTAPRSVTDYAYFQTGAVETTAGDVRTGPITLATSHAPMNMSFKTAASFYDNTGHGAADVVVGEDEHGIWMAGAVRPGLADELRYALKASKVSGDWRTVGGVLELVGVLSVSAAGFPVPFTQTGDVNGKQVALVAAGVVVEDEVVLPQVVFTSADIVDEIERRAALRAIQSSYDAILGNPAERIAELAHHFE